jgi:MerR HTH family regulatory protein
VTNTWSTVEAAARAGVTVRQLTYWADRGYLRPERVVRGAGRGEHAWRWDETDIDAAARFGALAAALGSGRFLLTTFAQALAVPYGDAVGILIDEGRFTVSIEVRRQQGAVEVSHAENGHAK